MFFIEWNAVVPYTEVEICARKNHWYGKHWLDKAGYDAQILSKLEDSNQVWSWYLTQAEIFTRDFQSYISVVLEIQVISKQHVVEN